jgi:dihydrofolate reductase
LAAVKGADIRFASGDVLPVHREMRAAAGDRNIWLLGGGDLVGQFHDQGLLDEVIVTVASVTLGTVYGHAFAELRYEVPRRPAG